ncbi:Transposase protein [Popillia japonica]|uniref:Transposase protein n=1 Tax=Popillia japonica TaxID=7064 RepID=A0AAW1L5Q2_POPJA
MNCIEATAASLDEKSKYCVLAFDEMMLEAGVAYSSSEDYVCGFQSNSTTDFCDHALVFMAMGVCKKWKQPVAYYFSKGGVGSTKLKQYLTEVIVAIQNVGLRIVATVCDQFQSNCKVYTMDTADFLLFFNKLFDSVNGTALVVGLPGNLKYAATKDSPHLNFWPRAVKTLEFIPPSLKH